MATETEQKPALVLPDIFHIHSQDARLEHSQPATVIPDSEPPLGVLSNFAGTFVGAGFNLIFRPNSAAPTTTTFPNPISGPPAPTPPNENVLELNLTQETLTFSKTLGSVPNRGLESQNDIFLNGVPYIQVINDVSNPATGKPDGKPSGIHFEPGLWMHVPASKNDPILAESLSRMASIPHGTTINAQGLAPVQPFPGAPKINNVDPTPFPIGGGNGIRFNAQTATSTDTPRLPQDLTKFIAAGTITQQILDDPNTVIRNHNQGKIITNTSVIEINTDPTAPELGDASSRGTANIAFLEGQGGTNPNANAAQMSATFWINTVQYQIEVPVWKPGQPPLRIKGTTSAPDPGAVLPTFCLTPPHEIKAPTKINVNATEIQYSQLVFLNFAGLTWPHVSVATLGQSQDVHVPASAFS